MDNGHRLGRCLSCDLHYVESMPPRGLRMTEIEEGHFAGSQRVLGANRQQVTERVARERFRGYVDLGRRYAPAGRWLDIGCGAGLLVTLARDAGYLAEGIELSADRRAVASRNTGAVIHGRPVEEVGFADGTFSVISLINVFSHLTSPLATLAELRRVLAPGGVLILATGEVAEGVKKSHVHRWNLGDHLYFLGDRTMSTYARRVGLRIVHHDRVPLASTQYTKDWFRARGRSSLRNAVKLAVANTPGAQPLLRSLLLRHQSANAVSSAVFALVAEPTAVGVES